MHRDNNYDVTSLVKDIFASFDPFHIGKTKEEQSVLLDQEIERFSKYMENLSDWKSKGPLIPQERALIKSYLVAKLLGKLDQT